MAPLVPFDPIVGALVQYLHELIDTNAIDAKSQKIRASVLWWLIHAPLLCKEGLVQCAQHPNRPWLVTFELHNPTSYNQRLYADEYLTYIHPEVTLESKTPQQYIHRPACHPDQHEPLEDKKLKFRWLQADRYKLMVQGNDLHIGNESAKTYVEASLKMLRDRVLFLNRLINYFEDDKEMHERSLIRDPWLYDTESDLCTVPLPKAVACFVAFLRFQHAFIFKHGDSEQIGPISTRCSLHNCNRPIKPERVPYEDGEFDNMSGTCSKGVNGNILPPGAPNACYWEALQKGAIKSAAHVTTRAVLEKQALDDELMKPNHAAKRRPYASASCYSFCSNRCRREFQRRFEDQLLCIRCKDLEPFVPNNRNGRPASIAQQLQAALERNDRVRRQMRQTADAATILEEFNVDKEDQHLRTIEMLNIDAAILYVASIVCQLPSKSRKNKWLPTTQNWRAVKLVQHQAASRIRAIYKKHNVATLFTNQHTLPKWMRDVHDKALDIL